VGDSADEHCGHGDVDHGVGDVHSGLVISDEAPMADHPTEGWLDHPSSGQDHEGGLGPFDDLDREVEEGGLVEQLSPVVGVVGEQVFDAGPAFDEGGGAFETARSSATDHQT